MELIQREQNEQWAIVELMGHGQTFGRVAMENGFVRVDVPEGEDEDRTEYYGMQAIYSIKFVSEEIARAYGQSASSAVVAYDTPIVTREQHQKAISAIEHENRALRNEIRELNRRLTAVNALPEPEDDDGNIVRVGPDGEEIPW